MLLFVALSLACMARRDGLINYESRGENNTAALWFLPLYSAQRLKYSDTAGGVEYTGASSNVVDF